MTLHPKVRDQRCKRNDSQKKKKKKRCKRNIIECKSKGILAKITRNSNEWDMGPM